MGSRGNSRVGMGILAVAVAVAVAVMGLVGVQEAAKAAPDRANPPKTVLKKGERFLQRGKLRTHCWGGRCVDFLAPEVSDFPHVDRVKAGKRLHIRIHYRERPTGTDLDRLRVVQRRGERVLRGSMPIGHHLKPVRTADGRIKAWDVYFKLRTPGRHYYLTFGGWWDAGDAFWLFHLKTARDAGGNAGPPGGGGDIDCDQVDGPIRIDPDNDPHNLDGENDGWACEE